MRENRIAEVGAGLRPIVITLREYETFRFLEIRLYRRDGNSGQLSPTEWAVGIDSATFGQLKIALDELSEYIQEWLGRRTLSVAETVHADMTAEANAQKDASNRAHQTDVRLSSWDGPNFFKARSEGARVVIDLNTENSTVEGLLTEGKPRPNLLGRIFAAYHEAKNRFLGPTHPQNSQLFQQLEHEWGVILGNYSSGQGP